MIERDFLDQRDEAKEEPAPAAAEGGDPGAAGRGQRGRAPHHRHDAAPLRPPGARPRRDGLDGWEQVQSDMPDIVVSDMMMPRMDGYELLKKIRETRRDPPHPGDPGHRQVGDRVQDPGAGDRRRRLPGQAGDPPGAGRARAQPDHHPAAAARPGGRRGAGDAHGGADHELLRVPRDARLEHRRPFLESAGAGLPHRRGAGHPGGPAAEGVAAAARHRQDRHPRPDPAEGVRPERGGVAEDEGAPRDRGAAAGQVPLLPGDQPHHPGPPGALRRLGIPAGPEGGGDPAAGPHHRRGRRLPRHDHRPPLPPGPLHAPAPWRSC